jgi:hypothetical protein
VLVDLERHRIVDLLPDRSAETLAAWLRAHPGVEIIARDRSGAYADGARQGAPEAVQVADRWHLLKNVGDALERVLLGQQAALRQAHAECLPAEDGRGPDAPAAPDTHAPTAVAAEASDAAEDAVARPVKPGTARRQARYAAVVALQAAGHTIRAIARQTDLSRMTVRKYLRAGGCPGPPVRSGMLTAGSAWEGRLRKHWNGGEHNAAALWRALRADGFPGSAGSIRRHVGAWRTARGRPGRRRTDRSGGTDAGPVPPPPPSPRQVRWWLLRPPEELTDDQAAYLDRLRARCPAAHAAQAVAQEFGRLVRERDRAAFDRWLEDAEGCGVADLAGVAAFMRRDYDAIVAALTLPWSNEHVAYCTSSVRSGSGVPIRAPGSLPGDRRGRRHKQAAPAVIVRRALDAVAAIPAPDGRRGHAQTRRELLGGQHASCAEARRAIPQAVRAPEGGDVSSVEGHPGEGTAPPGIQLCGHVRIRVPVQQMVNLGERVSRGEP